MRGREEGFNTYQKKKKKKKNTVQLYVYIYKTSILMHIFFEYIHKYENKWHLC